MNTRLCHYHYDALDMLTGLEPFGQEKLQRFYRHQYLVTELQSQASQSVFQHGSQLLAEQKREGGEFKSRLLATDQQRSILHVTTPPVRQAYSPYGQRRVESGLGSLLAFNGELVDPATGHYLLGNGHRAFNPVLMRFNSPDSLSPFGRGGLNPYAYCLGDPVNFSDPTGRVARLITSLFSVANARVVLSPSIPFRLGRDALQWGAAGKLPFKYTVGATGTTIAGVTTILAALTGVGSAVAAINKDTEAAAVFGFMALGLGAATLSARLGSFWAARDPKTIPALKNFVENKGHISTNRLISPRPSQLNIAPPSTEEFAPSAPLLTPGNFSPSAPPMTPRTFFTVDADRGIKRRYDGTPINERPQLQAKRRNIRESTNL
jgi:RHS repeat-associated protein